MSDGGNYKCVADYGGMGEHTSQSATLTVYGLWRTLSTLFIHCSTLVGRSGYEASSNDEMNIQVQRLDKYKDVIHVFNTSDHNKKTPQN